MDQVRETRWRRATTARHVLAVGSVAALLAVTAACGSDAGADDEPGADGSTVTVYFVDGDGRLRPVQHEVKGADGMRPQGRAVAAVEALVHTVPDEKGLSSHWAERCAAGAKVEELDEADGRVSVKVHGPVGVVCKRTGAKLEQQRQQLAWTVVANLDSDPATPVRFLGFNDTLIWDGVVADENALAD